MPAPTPHGKYCLGDIEQMMQVNAILKIARYLSQADGKNNWKFGRDRVMTVGMKIINDIERVTS